MDAMEDIHQVPGIGSRALDAALDIFTVIRIGACHTFSLHVIIIPLENMDLAEKVNLLQLARLNVSLDTQKAIMMINGKLNLLTQFQATFRKFKQN